ncbi:alcohol dehydrogenase, class IV [Mycobacteroides abscessus subsp. bolletii]|uniref:maleylacetate reductase n=1 Tax=Mycobacteroides abscessus TaxID=36809 RepID=UPI00092C5BF0|nr:maleylacetate reductase [Mycobacteroides abscessus]SIJ30562.1 alcohol dehydrogenase, class IV [Mycobacteroides abscessus subsp. bolletii]SLF73363.1 alcohol dehydrogenase, class IV [Mycobacteroides abscessus subsp. bolletii]
MLEFDHTTLGQRVLFGLGKANDNLRAEITRRGANRVMVISSSADHPLTEQVNRTLRPTLIYTDTAPHVPIEHAEKARAAAQNHDIDTIVSIGGGSTTGLAKAVALTTGLPIISIPTTYSGSEATNVWGITENARKSTGVDDKVLPATVIYDATLMSTLPVQLSVASGLNALAHSIDAMWAPRTDPINQVLALEAIKALSSGLSVIKAAPTALAGHERSLYGAYLSAVAFASAGSGMHHKICHVLGGAYNLPHAQTHAIVLPYVVAYNARSAAAAAARIAAAFGAPSALDGLQALRQTLNAPVALRDYGFDESDIPGAVELILPVIPPTNPRPVTRESMTELLVAAWSGRPPKTVYLQ